VRGCLGTIAPPPPSELNKSILEAWSAGASPTSSPAPMHASAVNNSTCMSSGTSSETWRRPNWSGVLVRKRWTKRRANSNPRAPPSIARKMLSVKSCRMRRHLPAPNARRIAISPRRVMPRAMRMPARLAVAISSTIPVTAISAAASRLGTTFWRGSKGRVIFLDSSRISDQFGFDGRNACCSCLLFVAMTAGACAAVTPAFRRPIA